MSSQHTDEFYTADNLAVVDALSGKRSLIPGTIVRGYHRDVGQYYEIVSRTAKFAIIRKIRFLQYEHFLPVAKEPERRVRIQVFEGEEWFSGDKREMVFGNIVPPLQTAKEFYAAQPYEIECPECRDLHQSLGHANSKSERKSRVIADQAQSHPA